MENEILTSLQEAVKALRSGGSNGRKFKIGPRQIRDMRHSLNMTQEEFADKLGVSAPTVRSWEYGVRKPGALSQVLLGALFADVKQYENA